MMNFLPFSKQNIQSEWFKWFGFFLLLYEAKENKRECNASGRKRKASEQEEAEDATAIKKRRADKRKHRQIMR